ncbi:MAG: hypothetical protein R3288_00215 [Woeseiaceae bacterium]|nr:hypothetical protein [Woeseiaceae bacterium]
MIAAGTRARAFTFVLLLLCAAIAQTAAARGLSDIKPAVAAMLENESEYAYLVISVVDSEDFLQIWGPKGTAELDFPQITDRQKALRPKIEEVCSSLGLEQTIVTSDGGLQFLDYSLPLDADRIDRILRRILRDVFGVSDDVQLEFEVDGFALPPPR